MNRSNQAVVGPSGCVDDGDPYSPVNSPWSPGFYTYRYLIRIPADCTPFYGGRLMVRSDAGSGNTFTWQVPMSDAIPPTNTTSGCTGFPIAIHEGSRSVTPPGAGANPYPDAGEFTYPLSPPTYQSFTNHVADVPLAQAEEGTVYKVPNGSGAGNFAWLVWNVGINPSAQTLANSLTWPGDSTDYTNHGDGGVILPGFSHVVRGYVEPDDPTDVTMHVGDWVATSTGSMNANVVQNAIKSHVDSGGVLRLLVWTDSEGTGSGARYQIAGFALFRMHGYRVGQGAGGSWLLLEFIKWDTACGQSALTTYFPVVFNK